jgi:hypothetical protein
MRKFPNLTRFGISAVSRVAVRAKSAAVAVGLLMALCTTGANAQYPVLYSSSSESNTAPLFGSSVMNLGDARLAATTRTSVVDSAFRGKSTDTNVQPASYMGDGYSALQSAECYSGYGPNTSCNVSYYFNGEALAFRREGSRRFGLTQNTFLSDIDFEWGGRLTLGKMCDCSNAYEFVYAGPFQWTRTSDVFGAAVNSKFIANPSTLGTAFNGSTRQTQLLQSKLNSFEVNRRWWAWDAISTLIGVRYVKFEENYQLASQRAAAPVSGVYNDEIDNDMVGLQIGGDLFFPTSLRTSVSIKGKAGAFANFATRELRMSDSDGAAVINGVDDVDIAGLFEVGVNGHYQITPSVRLSGGYEVWFVPGVATEARQASHFLNANSGTAIRMTDDVVFHGFTMGAQLLY